MRAAVRNGETPLHQHIHSARRGDFSRGTVEAARTFASPVPGASPRAEAHNMRWLRLDPVKPCQQFVVATQDAKDNLEERVR
jgi:hypothetical protein